MEDEAGLAPTSQTVEAGAPPYKGRPGSGRPAGVPPVPCSLFLLPWFSAVFLAVQIDGDVDRRGRFLEVHAGLVGPVRRRGTLLVERGEDGPDLLLGLSRLEVGPQALDDGEQVLNCRGELLLDPTDGVVRRVDG